ncbi:15-hydroxyprostaglandin dehydrogenase [NAD(+)] [Manduca sexta]|uniref:Uncharacterized protein n=1 Tax=Manduca sexta TaxID=7130 RepID=A0A921ZPZ1_MANSE|nr:15-hydroxyprostaglandin dehydrogenase [NAD(+)] [Manduca sexta]KAG6461821.1 hypothetical protein O3G_MSEX012875 [Manduca sexta]
MYVLGVILCLAVTSQAEPENDLNGKVAVVTGGAKGIGYAIADNYLKNGAKAVVVVDKKLPEGLNAEENLKFLYGEDKVFFIHGDVTTDLDKVWHIIFKKFDYVDILVNNAGILDESDPVGTIYTNTLAPMLWSEKFFEFMRKDKGGKGGTIMNVASVVSYFRNPFFWYYKTSKFALLGHTLGLGHEFNYQKSGVRVYAISPGFTYTDMTDQQMVIDEQLDVFTKFREVLPWQTADVVGQASVTLYKTGKTGVGYTIEGGELSVSPYSLMITADELHNL